MKKTGKTAELVIRRLPIAELRPHKRNPRKHPEPGTPAWEALKRSLKRDYFDPIVYNQRNKLLVSGHLRAKVLKEAGYTEADCSIVDYDEPTHIARMLAANQQQGGDSASGMAEIAAELERTGVDPSLAGFLDGEFKALLASVHAERPATQNPKGKRSDPDVRMIPMMLTQAQHKSFTDGCNRLKKALKTDNITDTVVSAVEIKSP